MARNSDETKKIDKFIGDKLTYIICKHNISRKELAKSINVSVQQLNKYESGMNRISSSRLFLIAKALKKKSTFLYEVLKEYLELNDGSIEATESPHKIFKRRDNIVEIKREKPHSTMGNNLSNEISANREEKLEYA